MGNFNFTIINEDAILYILELIIGFETNVRINGGSKAAKHFIYQKLYLRTIIKSDSSIFL